MEDKTKTRILAAALQAVADAIYEVGAVPVVRQRLISLCELRGLDWDDIVRVADETNGCSVSEPVRRETVN